MATDTKFKLESKFIAPDGKTHLKLYAAEGKNGINLGATLKVSGGKAQTGMQTTVKGATDAESESLARAEFDKRVADALANGFALRSTTGSGQIGRRSQFSTLPPSRHQVDLVASGVLR